MFDDGDTLEIDTSTWVPEKSFNIEVLYIPALQHVQQ